MPVCVSKATKKSALLKIASKMRVQEWLKTQLKTFYADAV
jgi:hypothetical protein